MYVRGRQRLAMLRSMPEGRVLVQLRACVQIAFGAWHIPHLPHFVTRNTAGQPTGLRSATVVEIHRRRVSILCHVTRAVPLRVAVRESENSESCRLCDSERDGGRSTGSDHN